MFAAVATKFNEEWEQKYLKETVESDKNNKRRVSSSNHDLKQDDRYSNAKKTRNVSQ